VGGARLDRSAGFNDLREVYVWKIENCYEDGSDHTHTLRKPAKCASQTTTAVNAHAHLLFAASRPPLKPTASKNRNIVTHRR
jgi:hypothetical protein